MNIENLAIDILEAPDTQQPAIVEPTPEITILPFETFQLIGGGSAAVLD